MNKTLLLAWLGFAIGPNTMIAAEASDFLVLENASQVAADIAQPIGREDEAATSVAGPLVPWTIICDLLQEQVAALHRERGAIQDQIDRLKERLIEKKNYLERLNEYRRNYCRFGEKLSPGYETVCADVYRNISSTEKDIALIEEAIAALERLYDLLTNQLKEVLKLGRTFCGWNLIGD